MKLHFSKYHGTGNDFILIDNRKNVMPDRSVRLIARLCDRHFGIGADGLIVLEESAEHDFAMTYYNSDGNPGTMCGNGGRCITAFAQRSAWIGDSCRFEAADGLHEGVVLPGERDAAGVVRLGMQDVGRVERIDEGYVLDTGSPHLVVFVDDVEQVDVFAQGRKFRQDERFAGGTNVNFVQKGSSGEIFVRTYERGVEDETLSCGTGVTAAAIATFLDAAEYGSSVVVKTRGGTLQVDFKSSEQRDRFSDVFLTGPVTEVFEGVVDLERFS